MDLAGMIQQKGLIFWREVINDKNFDLFFQRYPKTKEYPRVMMVSNSPIDGKDIGFKRVVFMEKNGKYLAWICAETLEEAEKEVEIIAWDCAKEIEEPTKVVLTLEQIAEKFNLDPSLIEIKIDK